MIELRYGKFVKDDIITFLQAIGKEVIQPDLATDLFEGNTYLPTAMEAKYGLFEGFLNASEMPVKDEFIVLVNKWTILQVKKKENKT